DEGRIQRHRDEQKQRKEHGPDPLMHRQGLSQSARSESTAPARSAWIAAPSALSRFKSGAPPSLSTNIGIAPTATAASTSDILSPTNGTPSSGRPKSSLIRLSSPGAGFRHAQPSSGRCGQT